MESKCYPGCKTSWGDHFTTSEMIVAAVMFVYVLFNTWGYRLACLKRHRHQFSVMFLSHNGTSHHDFKALSSLQKQANIHCRARFLFIPLPSTHLALHASRCTPVFTGHVHPCSLVLHTCTGSDTPVWLQVCARHTGDQRHPGELYRHALVFFSSSLSLSLAISRSTSLLLVSLFFLHSLLPHSS